MADVECVRAVSMVTRCVVRHGAEALDGTVCAGCGEDPRVLLKPLGQRSRSAKGAADALEAFFAARPVVGVDPDGES